MAKKSKKKSKETELQKAFKWINSLSGERVEYIKEFANWQSKKDMKNTLDVLDRCMTAAIVNVLDIEWSIIQEIRDNMVHFLEEDTKKMGENNRIYGGLEMAIKKINEQEKLIVKRVNELIDQGVKQKEMVKTLSIDFPMLSKAMITNAIKKVKSERLENTEEAARYILEDNKEIKDEVKKEDAKKIAKEVARQIEKELEKEDHIADVGQMIEESKEEVKEEKAMSKLKIKKVELEGEFGSYIREGNKVIAGEITFNSLEELEEYQRKEIELFNRRMEEIREVYKVG
ncbi:hypothetical protein ACQPUY_16950 [Clostridium nigeriense]|uniref:hypothetical protein n=1 Tax=Clostridium nigeriense TaxID=1805470 RepID=UPI003D337955